MSEEKPFGYEGCTLTIETSDNDKKTTFAPLATGEKRIDVAATDYRPDKGLVYALAVAAAGRHHVLVYGRPLSSREYAAKRISQFMTNLTADEQLSVNRIYDIAGLRKPDSKIIQRPFRIPHASASIEGMCGGGAECKPGEISLAHNGVLYLENAPEFKSSVLQMLKTTLANGSITLSRAGKSTVYPAKCQLVMTANPCPCGQLTSPSNVCLCSAESIKQYWSKFGALLTDHVAIRYNCQNSVVPMFAGFDGLREHIKGAVDRQLERQGKFNQDLTPAEVVQYCKLSNLAKKSLDNAQSIRNLSELQVANIIKLARTVLDMKGNWDEIGLPSITMAIELFGTLPAASGLN